MVLDKKIGTNENSDAVLSQRNELLRVKPRVDIYETEESIVVLLEMPNVEKDDINVKVENGFLYISGRRENEMIDGEYLLRETRDVQFERVFELEKDLDVNNVNAVYNKGVLKLTIGKKEKSKPQVIEIN